MTSKDLMRAFNIDHLGGLMDVRGILGGVVNDIGRRIVGGEWKPGDILPTEVQLLAQLKVGRSVVREAMRILNAKGLVRSRPMEGTKVMPRSEWRHLDPDLIQWRIQAGDRMVLLNDLLHVRLALEPGIARMATLSRSRIARKRIDDAWRGKVAVLADMTGSRLEQRAKFILADLEFHRSLLAAAESEILAQLCSVIEAALGLLIDLQMRAKGATTELVGMEESIELHERVYEAFSTRNADAAEAAMRHLIERAILEAKKGFRSLER